MHDVDLREQHITKTSIVGIIANIFLASLKAVLGLMSGSIAIILDAVNNLTDAMSSFITILGIKLAKRKPDAAHPFGYGRIEYFSAILISALILMAGVTSLKESASSIINPEMADISPITLACIVAAIIVKLVLGKYVQAQGKKYNSDALIASGVDASFDAVISASTLVGAALTMLFHFTIDGWIGGAISILIIKAGLEMLMDSLNSVIGCRPESEITRDIKKSVASVPGVRGAYDLVLHNYGPDSAMGAVHVEINSDMNADEIHKLTRTIQMKIEEEFHIFLTVGIYSVNPIHEMHRQEISKIAKKHEGVLNTHGVFIDEEKKYVSFDVMTDFTVPDRKVLVKEIADEVAAKVLPGYVVEPSLDTNYSD